MLKIEDLIRRLLHSDDFANLLKSVTGNGNPAVECGQNLRTTPQKVIFNRSLQSWYIRFKQSNDINGRPHFYCQRRSRVSHLRSFDIAFSGTYSKLITA
jgi:hypothetical protein